MQKTSSTPLIANWRNLVAQYQISNTRKSVWQICNSLIPFLSLWYVMYLSLSLSYWLTLLLSLPTAGFVVRLFIIQHDCGHGSFFKSRRANDWIGIMCSLLTWAPYYYWRKGHSVHHAHASNLEHRGIGDIYTMTVDEYRQKSLWGKLQYRFYRHPLILFLIGPTLLFVLFYRFPASRSKALKTVRYSIYWTNLALFFLVGGLVWLIGWQAFILVHLPVIILASSIGTWLFYVQHQFKDTYWSDKEAWDYSLAALQGSSYYKLPKILQWFTGNIGFHHIHHLSPRIPNYLLEKCHDESPLLQDVAVLTLTTSMKTIFLNLWDEEQKKLIGFHQLKA